MKFRSGSTNYLFHIASKEIFQTHTASTHPKRSFGVKCLNKCWQAGVHTPLSAFHLYYVAPECVLSKYRTAYERIPYILILNQLFTQFSLQFYSNYAAKLPFYGSITITLSGGNSIFIFRLLCDLAAASRASWVIYNS